VNAGARKATPTIEVLRDLLAYDPETGALTWLIGHVNRVKAGDEAGSVNSKGYREVGISGRNYKAHRLAWAIHCGQWPAGEIDHEDGCPANNRIRNLREVAHAENGRNQKAPSTNKSGRIGVCWHARRQKWQAHIWAGGRQTYLGLFEDFSDACAARESAEREHGYHPNHGRS